MITAYFFTGVAGLLSQAPPCVCFEQRGFTAGHHAYQQQQQNPATALGTGTGTVTDATSAVRCRSNSTHIFWTGEERGGEGETYQSFPDAVEDCVQYLRNNIMPFDVPNLLTLGFPDDDVEREEPTAVDFLQGNHNPMATQSVRRVRRGQHVYESAAESDTSQQKQLKLPDGLSDGIVNRTVHLALQTKRDYVWADNVPRHIFYEYILSFACTNEARTNWRPLFTDVVKKLINDANDVQQVEDVVELISKELWSALSPNPEKPIHFVAGQTPLIFDPMSVIAYGYASCTGMSIVLVFALRAAGIPARLVGTPAWNGDVEKGNHNWVEVYTHNDNYSEKGEWRILEGNGDSLQKDPCERWFCNSGRFDGNTRVFAARLDRTLSDGAFFPLAWDTANHDVPAEDRTDWYTETCSKC